MSMDFMGVIISDVNLNFFHGFVVQKANHFGIFCGLNLQRFITCFFPKKKTYPNNPCMVYFPTFLP